MIVIIIYLFDKNVHNITHRKKIVYLVEIQRYKK